MNENTAKLARALRSGEYEQGQGHLRPEDDRYCCLGVACDLFLKEHPETSEWVGHGPMYDFRVHLADDGTDSSETELPEAVREWLGWADTGGRIDNPDVRGRLGNDYPGLDSLAELNDSGLTFAQIADIIEEQWA